MTPKLIALVIPLGLDTFAVAAGLGGRGIPVSERLRVSLLMSGFEAGMPLLGLALGAPLGHAIGSVADYVAVAVLVALGLYTLLAVEEQEEAKLGQLARIRGWGAVLLGLSISLDELAIGFTLGLLRVPVVWVVAAIAVQAFVFSQVGLRLGARIGKRAVKALSVLPAWRW